MARRQAEPREPSGAESFLERVDADRADEFGAGVPVDIWLGATSAADLMEARLASAIGFTLSVEMEVAG